MTVENEDSLEFHTTNIEHRIMLWAHYCQIFVDDTKNIWRQMANNEKFVNIRNKAASFHAFCPRLGII